MKRIWKLSLLVISINIMTNSIKAQVNLVPNWSFEDNNQCPDNWDQLYKVNDWSKYNGESPDYWNACDTTNIASVPHNLGGYQYAASGNSYVGMVLYSLTGSTISSYREYIGAQLVFPLVSGTLYYVMMKVSASIGDTTVTQLKYACNNQCVLFTTALYSQSNPLTILNFAQLRNLTVITDTINWTTLRWNFVADSSYQYIALGNFFNDSLTNGVLINPTGGVPFAYYYIDNICVSTDSMYCEALTTLKENSWSSGINVYPNPCINELSVKIKNQPFSKIVVNVYDLNGRLILTKNELFKNYTFSIDVHDWSAGMYLLVLHLKEERKKILFIKN